MSQLLIFLSAILIIYMSYLSIIGIKYYKYLPHKKKDWINNPNMSIRYWYKGFKIWRYANIPDDGTDEEFTKLNKKIKPLAKKNLFFSLLLFIMIFGKFITHTFM